MSRRPRQLLAVESPFPEQHSTLRFLEPPGTCVSTLWERLFNGTYDKPFIVDSGLQRFLHFDLDAVQSAMDLRRPDRLCLAYTRKMMAFLLFNQAPKRVLLLGLGGGSLAKFCCRRLPSAHVTAIELNAHVLSLRPEFGVPDDDARFRVLRGDGADYVSSLSSRKDVIVADACDKTGIAAQLASLTFYANARRSLAPGGIFVANLCGDKASRAAHLTKIRQAFDDEYLALPVRADGNVIVLAFRDGVPSARFEVLEPRAGALRRSLGLDFPRFARRIAIERQRRGHFAAQ